MGPTPIRQGLQIDIHLQGSDIKMSSKRRRLYSVFEFLDNATNINHKFRIHLGRWRRERERERPLIMTHHPMKPKGIENGEAIHKRTYKVQTLWNGSTVAPSTYLLTAINGDNYNLSSMVENSSGGSRNRYILSRLVLSWHTTTEESYHAIQVGEYTSTNSRWIQLRFRDNQNIYWRRKYLMVPLTALTRAQARAFFEGDAWRMLLQLHQHHPHSPCLWQAPPRAPSPDMLNSSGKSLA